VNEPWIADLKAQLGAFPSLESQQLLHFLQGAFPEAAPKTLAWKIHLLKQQGILTHLGRGRYAWQAPSSFAPSLSPLAKKLFKKLEKDYPSDLLCVWENTWLWPTAQPHLIVIETEKNLLDRSFDALSELSRKIFLRPDALFFERYIAPHPQAVVLTHGVSEAPTLTLEGVRAASLEKLIVDSLIHPEWCKGFENTTLLQNTQNLNLAGLRRYARRRGKITELETLLLQTPQP